MKNKTKVTESSVFELQNPRCFEKEGSLGLGIDCLCWVYDTHQGTPLAFHCSMCLIARLYLSYDHDPCHYSIGRNRHGAMWALQSTDCMLCNMNMSYHI